MRQSTGPTLTFREGKEKRWYENALLFFLAGRSTLFFFPGEFVADRAAFLLLLLLLSGLDDVDKNVLACRSVRACVCAVAKKENADNSSSSPPPPLPRMIWAYSLNRLPTVAGSSVEIGDGWTVV